MPKELSERTLKEIREFLEENKVTDKPFNFLGTMIMPATMRTLEQTVRVALLDEVRAEIKQSIEFKEKCYEKACRTPVILSKDVPYKSYFEMAKEIEEFLIKK